MSFSALQRVKNDHLKTQQWLLHLPILSIKNDITVNLDYANIYIHLLMKKVEENSWTEKLKSSVTKLLYVSLFKSVYFWSEYSSFFVEIIKNWMFNPNYSVIYYILKKLGKCYNYLFVFEVIRKWECAYYFVSPWA